MKVINIFLASSIDEFKTERDQLQCFISDISENFRDRYDTDIRVLRCEKVDPRYVKGRSQDEFNELIRGSEMCIFLFFTKAGEYTLEEFEVARSACEASENGKPKIYTYFKTVDGVEVDKSVLDFMSELDKNLKHFYQMFDNIDTVKLRVLLNLKLQEMDFVSIDIKDGKCYVDGIEALDSSNVAEFHNNASLTNMLEEYDKICEEYDRLKASYNPILRKSPITKEFEKKKEEKDKLYNDIERLRKNIFDFTFNFCSDEMNGETTHRQREAYRLFEKGDLEGALRVIDEKEIDEEYKRNLSSLDEIMNETKLKLTRQYIKEYKTRIEILEAGEYCKDKYKEIIDCYEKILPTIMEYRIELDTLVDYVNALFEYYSFTEVFSYPEEYTAEVDNINQICKKIEDILTAQKNVKPSLINDLYNCLAFIYDYTYSDKSVAFKYILKNIDYADNHLDKAEKDLKEKLSLYSTALAMYDLPQITTEFKDNILKKMFETYDELNSNNPVECIKYRLINLMKFNISDSSEFCGTIKELEKEYSSHKNSISLDEQIEFYSSILNLKYGYIYLSNAIYIFDDYDYLSKKLIQICEKALNTDRKKYQEIVAEIYGCIYKYIKWYDTKNESTDSYYDEYAIKAIDIYKRLLNERFDKSYYLKIVEIYFDLCLYSENNQKKHHKELYRCCQKIHSMSEKFSQSELLELYASSASALDPSEINEKYRNLVFWINELEVDKLDEQFVENELRLIEIYLKDGDKEKADKLSEIYLEKYFKIKDATPREKLEKYFDFGKLYYNNEYYDTAEMYFNEGLKYYHPENSSYDFYAKLTYSYLSRIYRYYKKDRKKYRECNKKHKKLEKAQKKKD